MKRFSFKLQKLLDLRAFREKEAEIKLGQAVAVRDGIVLQLQQLAEREMQARRAFAAKVNATGDFIAHENYLERIGIEREEQLEAQTQSELIVEKERTSYIKAHKEKLIVTHLRDKKERSWKKEQNKQQEAAIEDLLNARLYTQQ